MSIKGELNSWPAYPLLLPICRNARIAMISAHDSVWHGDCLANSLQNAWQIIQMGVLPQNAMLNFYESYPMPVKLHEEANGKIVILNLSGKLAKEDYAHFTPEVERVVKVHGRVRVLVRMHESEKGSGLFAATVPAIKLWQCPELNVPMKKMRSTMP